MTPVRGRAALLSLVTAAGCGGGASRTDDRVAGANLWAGPPGTGYVFLRVREDTAASTEGSNGAETSTAIDTSTDSGADASAGVAVDRDRPLLLHTRDDRWEMRIGEPRWSRGTPYATWAADRSGGFSLAGTLVIPGQPDVGTEQDGARVISQDAVTTWGGTFPEVLTIEVGPPDTGHADTNAADTGAAWPTNPTGPAGTYQFARDLGPVALTLPDGRWELVRWESLPPEETAPQDTGGAPGR